MELSDGRQRRLAVFPLGWGCSWSGCGVEQYQVLNKASQELWMLTLWVTNPQCHDFSFAICQKKSTVSLNHWITLNVFASSLSLSPNPLGQLSERTHTLQCSECAEIKSQSLTHLINDWEIVYVLPSASERNWYHIYHGSWLDVNMDMTKIGMLLWGISKCL